MRFKIFLEKVTNVFFSDMAGQVKCVMLKLSSVKSPLIIKVFLWRNFVSTAESVLTLAILTNADANLDTRDRIVKMKSTNVTLCRARMALRATII